MCGKQPVWCRRQVGKWGPTPSTGIRKMGRRGPSPPHTG